MSKAMKFNLAMITYSGYLPFLIVMLIIYSLLSYAMGFNTHFTRHETGIGELIDRIEDMRELAYSGSLIFITAVFYILPLTRVRNGRFENASAAVLPLSLPVSRREYAHSRFLYTGISSLLLVILFTGLIATGIWCRSGSLGAEGRIAVRTWFALNALMINAVGMLSVAACLGAKIFLIPVSAIFIAASAFIWLIPPECIYQFTASPFFWPVIAAFIILTNKVSVLFGTSLFRKRDI
ncbi:MAG: hypothetical protein WAP56_07435 [Acetivibrionales bacterium]